MKRMRAYSFGSAGLGTNGADEVEDGFGGLGEVGVGGELGVFLGFLHGFQESSTVSTLERYACH